MKFDDEYDGHIVFEIDVRIFELNVRIFELNVRIFEL